ncbi:MAG: type II toxin-antitoxin system PemK/MazF family toxin [Candidatus Scalindua rubra]|uniref:YdcE protein, chain A n=1 Tax=Candidatus Scalindua brodae TaxID=237368 RepID=A0A0B0ELP6_9BACT|nr:MAG: YdcE protein, chain A [Candidatus Scalindua brodae]MBZ0109849.1 type II toxin-antitoxin system PemK/MazF family toxin [Candidatus Scalindua rubra]TWU33074.1 mRNA interferase MazF [Candidatus Brocadiaceae bacterium S225]
MTFFKWDVYLANLDPAIGSEQGKTRPVLIISEDQINQIMPVINVLPITSRKAGRKVYPNEALIPKGVGGTNERVHRLMLSNPNIGQKAIDKETWND